MLDGERIGRSVLVRDVTQRVNRQVWERNFQELLIGTASEFMRRSVASYDDVINEKIEELGRLVDADRCSVFLLREGGEFRDNTHEWCAENIEPQKSLLQGLRNDDASWWMRQLMTLEPFVLNNLDVLAPHCGPLLRGSDQARDSSDSHISTEKQYSQLEGTLLLV